MSLLLSHLAQAAQGGSGSFWTEERVRAWLGLFVSAATPLAIYWFTRQANIRKRETERERQQDAVVADFFGAMKHLILEHNLRGSEDDSNEVVMARTLTLTAFSRLGAKDGDYIRRKGEILQFLHEAGLITKDAPRINLSEADLTGAYLRGADLRGASLSEADLSRADLTGAYLRGADLSEADLSEAYLSRANLSRASLRGANLRGADLRGANLSRADLRGAYLRGADLREAVLIGANLSRAYLRGADLTGASLQDLQWDAETTWPEPKIFEGARNIPEGLKARLSL